MTSDNHSMLKISSCSIVDSADEVDLGSEITLECIVCSTTPMELTGEILLIKNQENIVIKHISLDEFYNDANKTIQFVADAPITLGKHTWSIIYPAYEENDVWCGEEISQFSFMVKPHHTNLSAWDVPSVIGCGETFNMKLGVSCSSGCQPDGWSFCVYDQDGVEQADVLVGDDVYAGTDSLYYAECELNAPHKIGFYNWEAKVKLQNSDAVHEDSIVSFRVRVLEEPDSLLTIVAVDSATQVPIQGVQVQAHPYRAFTNENGIAEVRVPNGMYTLFVSGKNYFPFRTNNEVKKDLTIRAELVLDEGTSDSDVWS